MAATRIIFYSDTDIQFSPIFLGGVMTAAANKPPLTVPNKKEHMLKSDLPISAKAYQVDYQFPTTFPLNTMAIVRLLRVIRDQESDKLTESTIRFFDAFWGSGNAAQAIKVENFDKILAGVLSADRLKELIELSNGKENKDGVKADAEALVATGAFGAPWMVVTKPDGEVGKFFGADRFEVMAHFIGKEWKGFNPERNVKL